MYTYNFRLYSFLIIYYIYFSIYHMHLMLLHEDYITYTYICIHKHITAEKSFIFNIDL